MVLLKSSIPTHECWMLSPKENAQYSNSIASGMVFVTSHFVNGVMVDGPRDFNKTCEHTWKKHNVGRARHDWSVRVTYVLTDIVSSFINYIRNIVYIYNNESYYSGTCLK